MHSCADRERALAKGSSVARTSWQAAASGLIDAIVGLWQRPCARSGPDMKVTVDQDKCVSSGMCVLNAGEVFDQRDDDGVVELLGRRARPRQRRQSPQGRGRMPALAIHIEE